MANDSLTRTIAQTPDLDVNTDDRNIVEFGLARSVGRAGSLIVLELRQLAEVTGAAHPAFLGDPGIDWSTVATARVSYYMGQGWFGELSPQGSPVEQARQRALMRYYENGDVAGTRDAWRRQADGDPRRIGGIEIQSRVASNLGQTGHVAARYRLAEGHGLEHR